MPRLPHTVAATTRAIILAAGAAQNYYRSRRIAQSSWLKSVANRCSSGCFVSLLR